MKYSELTNLQKQYRKYSIDKEILLPHLTAEEALLYDGGRFSIAGNADYSVWHKMHFLWNKIDYLVKSDSIEINAEEFVTEERYALYIISDDLGTKGVLNHANGKVYDSKSKYYADLKASGHVIVESGMDKPREMRGDFDCRKDVAKALNQLGY